MMIKKIYTINLTYLKKDHQAALLFKLQILNKVGYSHCLMYLVKIRNMQLMDSITINFRAIHRAQTPKKRNFLMIKRYNSNNTTNNNHQVNWQQQQSVEIFTIHKTICK